MDNSKRGFVYKFADAPVVLAEANEQTVRLLSLDDRGEHQVSSSDFEDNSIEFNIDDALRQADPIRYNSYKEAYLKILRALAQNSSKSSIARFA